MEVNMFSDLFCFDPNPAEQYNYWTHHNNKYYILKIKFVF
jgi:hypothetical protein